MKFKRIAFAVVAALPVSLAYGSSEAQQAARIPRVGFLAPQGRSLPLLEPSRKGLSTSAMSKAEVSSSSRDLRKGSMSASPRFLPSSVV